MNVRAQPDENARDFQCRDCGKFYEGGAHGSMFSACPVCDLDNAVYADDDSHSQTGTPRRPRGIHYVICVACGSEYQKSKKDSDVSKCPQCKYVNVLRRSESVASAVGRKSPPDVADHTIRASERLGEEKHVNNRSDNPFSCRECGAPSHSVPEPNRFCACSQCGFDNAIYEYEPSAAQGPTGRLPRGIGYAICVSCGAEYHKSKTDYTFSKCPQCKYVNTLNPSKAVQSNGSGSAMSDSEKGKSGGGSLGTFAAVLAAIIAGVVFFAPERLPSGVGLAPVPMEVSFRDSVFGEGRVAIIQNPTGKTLHNVVCIRKDRAGNDDGRMEESWAPSRQVELGWAEGWRWQKGDTLTISASGYSSKTWMP